MLELFSYVIKCVDYLRHMKLSDVLHICVSLQKGKQTSNAYGAVTYFTIMTKYTNHFDIILSEAWNHSLSKGKQICITISVTSSYQ